GRRSSARDELGVGRLREQHDAAVRAEVRVAQLGVAVETQPAPHQGVEVPGKEVGEVEGAELGFVQRRERGGTGEELVAVRTRQAPYARERGEQRVERAAGAAVGVRDEDGTPRGRR